MVGTIDLRKLEGSKKIFVVREQGYFPVAVSFPDGRIVVVLRDGAGHMGIEGRLYSLWSDDSGESWSLPVEIVDSQRDDRNPSVGLSVNNVLVLGYHVQGCYTPAGKYQPGEGSVDTYLTRSHDSGETWEEAYPLSYQPLNSRSPFGRMLTLDDGTLLMPMYGHMTGVIDGEEDSKTGYCSYLLRSKDEGLTWSDPSLVAADLNEASFLRFPHRDIIGAIRGQEGGGGLQIVRSGDDGYTWTTPTRITGPQEHPWDMTLLKNGYVLLVYGQRNEPYGANAMISKDGGRTWEYETKLIIDDTRPGKDCGYPTSVRRDDGTIVTIYYSAGDHMDGYRGDGAFAKALIYSEDELIKAVDST